MENTVYNILTDGNEQKLSEKVNQALREGWQLQGGVAITAVVVGMYDRMEFAQAMIKKAE